MSNVRESHDSHAVQRMMSARRLKVNELRNRVEELSQQLYEVERENKLLKRQNVIKDRVIDKHEGDDSEVSMDLENYHQPFPYICGTLNYSFKSKTTVLLFIGLHFILRYFKAR